MITVKCKCGSRIRGEAERLRGHPPCPACGAALPDRPEAGMGKPIPFECACGLEMTFPWRRGGLWFDCPECGRRTIIPGRGSSEPHPLPLSLPREVPEPAASLAPWVILVAVAAVLVALGIVLLA